LATASPFPAFAHDPFEVTTDAHIAGAALQLHTTLSLLTAGRVCLPARGRAPLVASEFPAQRAALESCARDFFHVAEAGAPLAPTTITLTPTVEDDLDVRVTYPRPTRSPLHFDALFLRRLTQPSAGVVLTVTGERAFLGQQVLRAESSTLDVSLEPDAASAPAPSFRQFFALGVRHILTGYDHMLFLFALLLACRGWRAVVGVITCFTVAHSITLALAGLDLVRLPARLVEALIAATIVAVGVENLWQARRASRLAGPALSLTLSRGRARGPEVARYGLTFAFGLLHGFGFAMALRELGLGARGAPIVRPLLGFNLGVEVGQLAVAAIALPALWQLRRVPLFARHGGRALSVAIAGVGLVWLLQRIS
jgi:hydrogenase/urease accessory protein HupE